MSITHPCFSAPLSEWIRNRAGEFQYSAVDRYFERTAWDDMITRRFHAPVVRRHRPLEDYMAPPLECGFVLREFCEPSVTDEELKRSDRFGKRARIPYFLFLRWQKPWTCLDQKGAYINPHGHVRFASAGSWCSLRLPLRIFVLRRIELDG